MRRFRTRPPPVAQSGRKAVAKTAAAQAPAKKVADPLYPSEKKSFRVGGDILVGFVTPYPERG